MILDSEIEVVNSQDHPNHKRNFECLRDSLLTRGVEVESLVKKIQEFQIAIPSWALGTGGTRFARFPGGGEPRSLQEKIEDVGILHRLNASNNAISLHLPWDNPQDANELLELAGSYGIQFDAVNSNTFQDQPDQVYSYKFGSLCHVDPLVRQQAIDHNKTVIEHGVSLGSKALTVWLADGSSFPGQHNFRDALIRTLDSLREIYKHLPKDWTVLIEYKPYEPHFYSMVIQDWGTSFFLANELGEKARCLVDLGHHLPNTNIEQIVSTLMMKHKLGGFHFNDSKYGDDDQTVGSLKPYQLFLIFFELLDGLTQTENPTPAWMIDASHNLKDPLEDLLQSVEAIKLAYAQALLIDSVRLKRAQEVNDVAACQEILQDAFRTDVRPLLVEARILSGAAANPIAAYRALGVRKKLVDKRGSKTLATGL